MARSKVKTVLWALVAGAGLAGFGTAINLTLTNFLLAWVLMNLFTIPVWWTTEQKRR